MSNLTEKEIIENTKQYIKNAEDILNGGNNELSETSEIEIYTLQATFEGLLKLYEKSKKDVLFYRDHIRVSTCPVCGKEFQHKRAGVKYCPICNKEQTYKNWRENLTGERLEERRRQSREATRRYRERLKLKGDSKNESC